MSEERARERLAPEVFELPVERIRNGYYTDAYFNHARATLLDSGTQARVLMQVFQRNDAILCGIDEALAVLRLCSHGWRELEVWALRDGDAVEPWETVLTIEGDYTVFAHLETVYLGVLARRTLVASNVRRVVEAAQGKDVLYFPARHDHFAVQPGDGYAARIGGVSGVSTDAQAALWGGRGVGTIPHALIAAYGRDTVRAAGEFARWAPPEMNIVALVDFENASAHTALEVARALGPRLWGVRLDTSGDLVDSTLGDVDEPALRGVNEQLVRAVRAALDAEGFADVRIVVSGGFDAERIRAFEARGVPVDAYGVGSSLIRGQNDFTADVVLTDGRPSAKVGRRHRPNPRLERVS